MNERVYELLRMMHKCFLLQFAYDCDKQLLKRRAIEIGEKLDEWREMMDDNYKASEIEYLMREVDMKAREREGILRTIMDFLGISNKPKPKPKPECPHCRTAVGYNHDE